jgi:hypothetical protein
MAGKSKNYGIIWVKTFEGENYGKDCTQKSRK